jgi:hypothetical protein
VRRVAKATRIFDKAKSCKLDLFSFDDDSDLRQQDQSPPTDTMVSRLIAAGMMDLDHACYTVFGRPSMRYANLRHPDDPHQHFEFDGRTGTRSGVNDNTLLP